MRQHDHIPMLPPMPKPAIKRRRRRSQGPVIILIIAGTIVALGVMAFAVKLRREHAADETLRRAEDLFQSGAFSKSLGEFEAFSNERQADPRAGGAKAAAELSRVAQSLDDDLANPERLIESLEKLLADFPDKLNLDDRWPVILTVAHRTARTRLERANRTFDAADLEAGQTWLRWLLAQSTDKAPGAENLSLAELDALVDMARTEVAAERRRRSFTDAVERAIALGTAADFAEAFQSLDRIRHGPGGADVSVSGLLDRLRQAMRGQVRFRQPPPPAETSPTVPLQPAGAYTLLSTRKQHKQATLATARPVFVRAKDLCFALEPLSGTVRWVLRVGFDAHMPELVPTNSGLAVIVPWFLGSDSLISLCDAATGSQIWSWQAPDMLIGPPAITRDSVFAATASGAIWQLDLTHGTPRSVAELPEPIDSPATLREDGRGLCVVGKNQAVYLFDVGREQTECQDLVLIGRRPDTARCQVMWVPPYVVIFENDLMSRCFARVLFQETAGHRQIREVPLDGRVWQPALLDGPDILVVTDRGKEYCFGLDPGNSAVNLYTAATGLKMNTQFLQPIRPYAARVSELPFVVLTDSLFAYRVDRSKAELQEVWKRDLPQPKARAIQPLQVVDRLVVAAYQDTSDDGVFVQAIDAEKGVPIWETRLASVARDLAAIGPAAGAGPKELAIVSRTDAGGIFLLSHEESAIDWQSKRLDFALGVSSIKFTEQPQEMIFSSDGGSRLWNVSTRDWTGDEPLAQSPKITSDLAIASGRWIVTGKEESRGELGGWTAFVTAERSIELRELGRRETGIHGVRIPQAPSGKEPWRWSPMILRPTAQKTASEKNDLVGVLASHPEGIVCRAELRRTDEITHLQVTECRRDLPPLADAPVAFVDRILCAGSNGRCVALDSISLRTLSEWQAAGPITCVASDSDAVFLTVNRSSIQTLLIREDQLEAGWNRKLDDGEWRLTCRGNGSAQVLLAYDLTGAIVALDRNSGETLWTYQAPAPLALPPQLVEDYLVFATVDGGIFSVPAPKNRAARPTGNSDKGERP